MLEIDKNSVILSHSVFGKDICKHENRKITRVFGAAQWYGII